jgi:hypothetical protein
MGMTAQTDHIEGEQERPDDLRTIIANNRQLRHVTGEALGALMARNAPPIIFGYGDQLARLGGGVSGRKRVELLTEPRLRSRLARVANWVAVSSNGDVKGIAPPKDVVADVLALGGWPFPELVGVTDIPIVRPDGSVCTEPGYDAISGLVYAPAPGLRVPPVPEQPTPVEVRAAAALFGEVFVDFPYDGEASQAATWAATLTPILRPTVAGPTPLFLFDKPKQGTGASLLADAIGIIVTGRDLAKTTAPSDSSEWRKKITSLLIEGASLIVFDNVDRPLDSGHLASVLTDVEWRDRILGRSEIARLPNRATWYATGNNLRVRGDIARRCIWSRMDAKLSRPWERRPEDFRHPRLLAWVYEERGRLLAAALTLIRAWISAGRPTPAIRPLGSYEVWTTTIGGILEVAGVAGFLANLHRLYEQADEESAGWAIFLGALFDWYGVQPFTTAELVEELDKRPELKHALPDDLATDEKNLNRRVGRAFSSRIETRYDDYRLVKAGDVRHTSQWQVICEGAA